MRIALLSFWSCPYRKLGVMHAGGMNIYLQYLAHLLAKNGHKVDIFTRSHREQDESAITKKEKGVNIYHIRLKGKDLYKNSLEFGKLVYSFIEKKKLDYDIFHAHYFYSGISGMYLKREINTPLITTFHTLSASKEIYSSIIDRKRKKHEKEIIASTDAVIASTDFEKNEIIDFYQGEKDKIFVVNPGVNHQVFKYQGKAFSRKKLNLSKTKKIILFIGRIDPVKGIHVLIKAVGKLQKNTPAFADNYQVLLIGGDITSKNFWQKKEVKNIQALIIEKGIDCCVKFLGSKPNTELPFYYSGSDLVVMPSEYESFGLAVLEAMACRSAVIASRVGGLKFLINNKVNGMLFETGNADKLCSIIWELLKDADKRKTLGVKAYQTSKKYCWEKQIAKLINVYKKVKKR